MSLVADDTARKVQTKGHPETRLSGWKNLMLMVKSEVKLENTRIASHLLDLCTTEVLQSCHTNLRNVREAPSTEIVVPDLFCNQSQHSIGMTNLRVPAWNFTKPQMRPKSYAAFENKNLHRKLKSVSCSLFARSKSLWSLLSPSMPRPLFCKTLLENDVRLKACHRPDSEQNHLHVKCPTVIIKPLQQLRSSRSHSLSNSVLL